MYEVKKLIFVFFIIALPPKAGWTITITQAEKFSDPEYSTYVGGIAAGMLWYNLANIAEGKPKQFCMPMDVNLGGQMAKTALAIGHGGNKDLHVAHAILIGLKKMFPC